jgi:hypothetical protein
MDVDGSHDEPVNLDLNIAGPGGVNDFINNNVTKHHELRVCTTDDEIALHVIDQTLIFPIPEHGSANNKWDNELKRFVG